MDFTLMSCPYCGRAVDSSDPIRYVCTSCGKSIYTNRFDVLSFIHPSGIEERFKDCMLAAADGNEKKAMDIAEGLVGSTGCCDHDPYFLRGCVYALRGEDGKALSDWKKALELLSNSEELDAYVCLLAKAVSAMVLYKEREYIEFNIVNYVDKLCDEIDSSSGMSCKAFVYYTIYIDCLEQAKGLGKSEADQFRELAPDLFRRVVAYHRNYWCLSRIIEEYLEYIGYDEETFEEDDNSVPHVYALLRHRLDEHISHMTEEDRVRIFDRWDDKSLKENIEPLLDAMVVKKSLLTRLRPKDAQGTVDIKTAVHKYVDTCLLIEGPADEPAGLSE
ncbi:MAG: hypothetical protein Q4Q58_06735 [Thermoplasmata archaeon]|nr:hypothetical protein [Thermoplasmata archaeon]